jgi:hypothetical protein
MDQTRAQVFTRPPVHRVQVRLNSGRTARWTRAGRYCAPPSPVSKIFPDRDTGAIALRVFSSSASAKHPCRRHAKSAIPALCNWRSCAPCLLSRQASIADSKVIDVPALVIHGDDDNCSRWSADRQDSPDATLKGILMKTLIRDDDGLSSNAKQRNRSPIAPQHQIMSQI